jgi:hypothetical protein
MGSQSVDAADHNDGMAATDDQQADIADVYAWHDTKANRLTVVATFDGFLAPGDPIEFDPNVLYTIHIDNTADPIVAFDWDNNDNDNVSDIQIYVRYGQNGNGDWGFQVENLPGTTMPLVAAVGETAMEGDVARATSDVFDDPFFFDLDGFQATAANLMETDNDADLGFASLQEATFGVPNDTFAGNNIKAIVLDMDLTATLGDDNPENFLQIWATTGRVAR